MLLYGLHRSTLLRVISALEQKSSDCVRPRKYYGLQTGNHFHGKETTGTYATDSCSTYVQFMWAISFQDPGL
jgi:hypothetical protein